MDTILNGAIRFFCLLNDKDIFEDCYKKALAKRLLSGRSACFDAERMVIAKLKTECGAQFTTKLESMFADIQISKQISDLFAASEIARESSLELSVSVLTTGCWPSQSLHVMTCVLPPEVSATVSLFTSFYTDAHSSRKLAWQTSLGTAEIKAMLATCRYELCVSTFQVLHLCVLKPIVLIVCVLIVICLDVYLDVV